MKARWNRKPPVYFFLLGRAARLPFEIRTSDSVNSAIVSGTVRLYTNCPSLRHSINSASVRIFRWCEIVAGVTPCSLTSSLHVKFFCAAITSKIRSRVSSPNAFEILSIFLVSIAKLSLAETAILHTEKPLTAGFSAGWLASALNPSLVQPNI